MVTATHPTSLSQALRLTPRPYQYEAVAALLAATARGVQRPLLVLPTGTGKTIVFALLVQRRRGRSLILAHRDELIRSEEHTSELQSLAYLVCRLLLEKKKKNNM